jgi:hypothetical protein
MTQLLKFFGSSRRDAAVGLWLDKHTDELGAISRHWFNIIRTRADDVFEVLHDGCPTACIADAGFAYVNAFTSHVNIGFFRGAELGDPKGLLQGTGKFMRHVKLKPGVQIDELALRELVNAAYVDMKQRIAAEVRNCARAV